MVEPDTTIGTYVGESDVEMIEAFDEFYEEELGSEYSRSAKVKEAMAMLHAIDETMNDLGWPEMKPPEKRHAVKQSLRDKDRQERERERRG